MPELREALIAALDPWVTEWRVDEAEPDSGRQPTSYTRDASDLADAALQTVASWLREQDWATPKDKYAEARQAAWADIAHLLAQESNGVS